MKVLPIKLSDEMYANLKAVSLATGISMAALIRQEIEKPLKKKAKKVKSKPFDLLQFMLDNPITSKGKDEFAGMTDDEILYGYRFNERGEKIWPKKKS